MKAHGTPSKDVQDLLRALGAHDLALALLCHKYDPQFLAAIVRCYRFLSLFCDKNLENQMLVMPYINVIVCEMCMLYHDRKNT